MEGLERCRPWNRLYCNILNPFREGERARERESERARERESKRARGRESERAREQESQRE